MPLYSSILKKNLNQPPHLFKLDKTFSKLKIKKLFFTFLVHKIIHLKFTHQFNSNLLPYIQIHFSIKVMHSLSL